MSDDELAAIRQKKLQEFQRRQATREGTLDIPGTDEVLDRIFRGRAWEVFNSASYQFPDAMGRILFD
jgi:hypothetical protein